MFTRIRAMFTKKRISDVTPQSTSTNSSNPITETDSQSVPTSVVGEVRVKPRNASSDFVLPPRGRRSPPGGVDNTTATNIALTNSAMSSDTFMPYTPRTNHVEYTPVSTHHSNDHCNNSSSNDTYSSSDSSSSPSSCD